MINFIPKRRAIIIKVGTIAKTEEHADREGALKGWAFLPAAPGESADVTIQGGEATHIGGWPIKDLPEIESRRAEFEQPELDWR